MYQYRRSVVVNKAEFIYPPPLDWLRLVVIWFMNIEQGVLAFSEVWLHQNRMLKKRFSRFTSTKLLSGSDLSIPEYL